MLSLKPIFTMLTAGFVVACAPEDQPDWMAQNDTIEVQTRGQQVGDQQRHQQVAEFRRDAEETLQELRSGLERVQGEVHDQHRDRWDDAYSETEEKWQELREDLGRLETAEADEQRDLREDIADRLAELEGEVAKREIEFAADRQALVSRTEERLSSLEQDLQQIEEQVEQRDRDRAPYQDEPRPGQQPQPGADDQPRGDQPGAQDVQDRPRDTQDRDRPQQQAGLGWFDQEIDRERIEEIRAELQEAREKAMAIRQDVAVDEDEYESEREELAELVEDLTREVRKARYDTRWMDDEIM